MVPPGSRVIGLGVGPLVHDHDVIPRRFPEESRGVIVPCTPRSRLQERVGTEGGPGPNRDWDLSTGVRTNLVHRRIVTLESVDGLVPSSFTRTEGVVRRVRGWEFPGTSRVKGRTWFHWL